MEKLKNNRPMPVKRVLPPVPTWPHPKMYPLLASKHKHFEVKRGANLKVEEHAN